MKKNSIKKLILDSRAYLNTIAIPIDEEHEKFVESFFNSKITTKKVLSKKVL